jgi:hypothetical protein
MATKIPTAGSMGGFLTVDPYTGVTNTDGNEG